MRSRGIPRVAAARRRRLAAALLVVLSADTSRAATHDDDVEWYGVHAGPEDRAPLHPAKGQAFSLQIRAFEGDLTGARIRTWDGAEHIYPMSRAGTEGPYDVWRGTVPGTTADFIYYRFTLIDGADRDHYNALGMWDDPPPRGDFLVDTTPLGRHPLGATPISGGTVFRVWAPNASTASVAGTFNGWSRTASPLRANRGFWQALVAGARAGDEYKFVFDGHLWRTDPRSRRQRSSAGNSVIVDPEGHAWRDAGWVTPPIEDLVIYEIHVGTFSGEGDGVAHVPGRFLDIARAHLDHLVELGINAIELMPVGEFAGDRSWGYNPAFLFAPETAYGTPEDLKALVEACHRRGIAVLLDVVYNHMGPGDLEGNILDYDGRDIYFYPPGSGYRETPWGPRLDYGRVEVRAFIRDNVRFWLEAYHLDGLRIDATDFIKVNLDGWRVLQDIARAADAFPGAVIIAEQLPNDPAVTRPIAGGGAGLQAQWNDAFHDNLRRAIGDAAFGDPDMGAVAAGIDHFGLPGAQAVNYIESHDEAAHGGRIARVADGSNPESPYAYGRAKVAAALVLFSAGIPMLLQGQELLEDRPFGDAPSDRVQWRYRERHADFFRFVKDAVRLRRELPALRASARQKVFHVNDGANVLAIHRAAGPGDDLVIVASLANRDFDPYELGFPLPGTWFEILDGDAAAYGGRDRGNGGRIVADGPPRDGFGHSAAIVLPRMGVLVFARAPLPAPGPRRGDCNGDGGLDLADAIRVLEILFLGTAAGDCPAACDANGDGARDIADAVYLLVFLFADGPPPPAATPACTPTAAPEP